MDHLIKGKDKYIRRYPEEDLVKILRDSGYHSDEWEETDPEEEEGSTSIFIYKKWWRSPAVIIFYIYFIMLILLYINVNLIYYFSFATYYTTVLIQRLIY